MIIEPSFADHAIRSENGDSREGGQRGRSPTPTGNIALPSFPESPHL